jgi:hypothetical protein
MDRPSSGDPETLLYSKGDHVAFRGLAGAPRLNGCVAVVIRDVPRAGADPSIRVPVVLRRNWSGPEGRVADRGDRATLFGVRPANLKRSVPQDLYNEDATCNRCRDSFDAPGFVQCCGRCRAAFYCCRECQRADWDGGHKRECEEIRLTRRQLSDKSLLPADPPGRVLAVANMVNMLHGRHQWAELERLCRRLLEEGPGPCAQLVWVHWNLAIALYYKGYADSPRENADEILPALDRCRELVEMRRSGLLDAVPDPAIGVLFHLDHTVSMVCQQRSIVLTEIGDLDGALRVLQDHLERRPDDRRVQSSLDQLGVPRRRRRRATALTAHRRHVEIVRHARSL